MNILSFDPGYDRLGWAFGTLTNSSYQLKHYGCIQTQRSDTLLQRYQEICTDTQELIATLKPDTGVLETVFFSKNTSTALQVSEVRGILIALLLQANCAVEQLKPNEIKLAVTGDGSADKTAMHKMVLLQTRLTASQSKEQHLLDDTIDAIAVGLAFSARHGYAMGTTL